VTRAARPSDPLSLRWGIVGTASIADRIVSAIRDAGAGVVAAVASRNGSRARAWAAARGIPAALEGYEALLDPSLVDVIYNPLPNSLHVPWTLRALAAGLPVLCEKPLACDAPDAAEVAAASRAAGVPVAEALMYRFHPLYDRLLGTLAAGAIGEVVSVSARFSFALDDPAAIPASAALGGGALADVGSYPVSLARLVLGAEPERALALERTARGGTGADATTTALLSFPGGRHAILECSIETHERHEASVRGTRGTIEIESPWFPGEEGSRFRVWRGDWPGACEEVRCPGGDGYRLEVADFARAVATGSGPRWPIEDAVANARAIDRIREAALGGTAIRTA